jgi:hypothetical protein
LPVQLFMCQLISQLFAMVDVLDIGIPNTLFGQQANVYASS